MDEASVRMDVTTSVVFKPNGSTPKTSINKYSKSGKRTIFLETLHSMIGILPGILIYILL